MVLISTHPTHLTLAAPFHPDLSFLAKDLKGRWKGQEVGWQFEPDKEAKLRELCLRLWGVNGTPEAIAETVDLRVTVDEQDLRAPIWKAMNNSVYLMGREIAASLKNRRAARPGRGVRFLQGEPRCRTELGHYWTSIPNGSIFTVRDVPVMAAACMELAIAGHGAIERLAA